jgi:uncharacterized protein (DUF1684 family)
MKINVITVSLFSTLLIGSCSKNHPAVTLSAGDLVQEHEIFEDFKKSRVESLTSVGGWLSLRGLYWFKEGKNSFGSAADNDLVLQHPALAAHAGSFILSDGRVNFLAEDGGVTTGGESVIELELAADITSNPSILESGPLSFYVIDRVGNLGLRVRDSDHPLRTNFKGLEYFPEHKGWISDARFEPYLPAHQISITNILGMRETMVSPGALIITYQGQEYSLDTILEDPTASELFIMFADGTTGGETYGGGRYLYVARPKANTVRVNFNLAYNPPCAFNEFATCPLPPSQNYLPFRLEAGEKTYQSEHLTNYLEQ